MTRRTIFDSGVFECGHVGRYWKIPLLPWRKPHWFCRHCNRRVS